MRQQLTDATVRALPLPVAGNKITYDSDVPGFGARVTKAGSRAFVLTYRARSGPSAGRQRRITIGLFPTWRTATAREEARELKRRVDRGDDPLAGIEADRTAPTIAELVERFEATHLPRCRPSTAVEYRLMLKKHILPELAHRHVSDVSFADVDRLHQKVSGHAPIRANRCVAVLSKAFALAIRWEWRPDNPCKGVHRNQEQKRQRYLSAVELGRLGAALAVHNDRDAVDAISLLLLSGARRGEVLAMRWLDLDLAAGIWVKPGAHTKQRTSHRVPLSGPALDVLKARRGAASEGAVWVFPGDGATGRRVNLKKDWRALCKAAELTRVRLHDLRHSYASLLASAGASLPLIGALLGHTQAQTTSRYAHLFDDPLRAATEHVGSILRSNTR